MLRPKPPAAVLLILITVWISWRETFIILQQISRHDSRKYSPPVSSSLKLGNRQLSFRSHGKWLNSVQYISDIQRCIWWAIHQSQLGEWVLTNISWPIFMNSCTSAMWKTHITLPTTSITFNRYRSTMNIHGRYCHLLPCMAGIILTLQRFSTYNPLLIHGKIVVEPSFMHRALSGGAISPPHMMTGISFERTTYLWSVQMYQINHTQGYIRRLLHSHNWTSILETHWRELGTLSEWTGAQIWLEYTHRQHIDQTSEWAVVLPLTLSQPYIWWQLGNELQVRLFQYHIRDHAWISYNLGPIYGKWSWAYIPTPSIFCSYMVLLLHYAGLDNPLSWMHTLW